MGTLQYGSTMVHEELFVADGLQVALLGRTAIGSLGLVSRVNVVHNEKYVTSHPNLFQGLRNAPGEYQIRLEEGAQPFALSTPRTVALPLLAKVKEELERMEKMGMITRVDGPTDWCARMVVVPKPDGKVRICVDLTKLNKSIRR